jgi:hypothetical protein
LDMTLDTFPAEGVTDYKAYEQALTSFSPGDAATVFTPGAPGPRTSDGAGDGWRG